MNFHLRIIIIDGLNLGDNVFNFKNELLISHPKDADSNIANAHVILSGALKIPQEEGMKEFNEQHGPSENVALQTVSTFLACFHLANSTNMPKHLGHSSMIATIEKPGDVEKFTKGGIIKGDMKTNLPNLGAEHDWKALNQTNPLYEKVNSILNREEMKNPQLRIALLAYQRALSNTELLQQFLDFVTLIEALLCDKEDLSYKFAMRTSTFSEDDKTKRYEIYEKLREIYRARSELVHGIDTTMYPYADYFTHVQFLRNLSKKILLKYIDLVYDNMTKKTVVLLIDKQILED